MYWWSTEKLTGRSCYCVLMPSRGWFRCRIYCYRHGQCRWIAALWQCFHGGAVRSSAGHFTIRHYSAYAMHLSWSDLESHQKRLITRRPISDQHFTEESRLRPHKAVSSSPIEFGSNSISGKLAEKPDELVKGSGLIIMDASCLWKQELVFCFHRFFETRVTDV